MSRKDFVAIAEAIRLSITQTQALGKDEAALNGIAHTARNLANTFADINPRFDRARFLAACGTN